MADADHGQGEEIYGEVQGNTLHLFAQAAGKFNVLVIGRRSDPAVAGYEPFVAAPVPEKAPAPKAVEERTSCSAGRKKVA